MYSGSVAFAAPDTAFLEAHRELPAILNRRGVPVAPAVAILDALTNSIHTVGPDTYALFESIARQRIERRDADDWPVLAAALALDCPIWTEDNDFFGCGVATWTTDRVELYLVRVADD